MRRAWTVTCPSHLAPTCFSPRCYVLRLDRPMAGNWRREFASPAERAAAEMSAIDSELLVLDRTAFGCTASYLTSETVSTYLRTIAEHGEVLLRRLREPDALTRSGNEISEAACSIAGTAGMFGFQRLTSLGRRLERAIQSSTDDAPALADALSDSLKASLDVIYDPRLATADG